MNNQLIKMIEPYTSNEFSLEQLDELRLLAAELSTVFPNYESAIFMLARIASITEIDKNAPKDAIDLEARFFEILNLSSNWDNKQKFAITKFTKFGSRISKIIDNSVSIRNSALGSTGGKNRVANTEKKYVAAEKIYSENLDKYGRYSAESAAKTIIEDYPEKKFSQRKLQTIISTLKPPKKN